MSTTAKPCHSFLVPKPWHPIHPIPTSFLWLRLPSALSRLHPDHALPHSSRPLKLDQPPSSSSSIRQQRPASCSRFGCRPYPSLIFPANSGLLFGLIIYSWHTTNSGCLLRSSSSLALSQDQQHDFLVHGFRGNSCPTSLVSPSSKSSMPAPQDFPQLPSSSAWPALAKAHPTFVLEDFYVFTSLVAASRCYNSPSTAASSGANNQLVPLFNILASTTVATVRVQVFLWPDNSSRSPAW